MPKMSVTVPFAMSQADAAEKLKGFVGKIKERYQGQVSNVTEEWVGNVLKFAFTTFGFTIKGDLNVENNQVVLDGDLPFAAMMFKGKIESEIKENLTKLLA
ncbi:MAG TPA: polyhydroxyalkanoic acid system family protein [Pirellulales bacterium]